MTPADRRPILASKAKLQFDRHAGHHVLLYPEAGLDLNPTAAAVLQLCDGKRSINQIVKTLAQTYATREPGDLQRDVIELLTRLEQRCLIQFLP